MASFLNQLKLVDVLSLYSAEIQKQAKQRDSIILILIFILTSTYEQRSNKYGQHILIDFFIKENHFKLQQTLK